MSQKDNPLELYVTQRLLGIDPHARPTRGSGSHTEIGDVSNKLFFVECKEKHTRDNVIMDYRNEYLKLCEDMPIGTQKIPIVVTENKARDKFVIIRADDFFDIVDLAYPWRSQT